MATGRHGYILVFDAVELEILRSLLNDECAKINELFGDVIHSPGSRAATIINLKHALGYAKAGAE